MTKTEIKKAMKKVYTYYYDAWDEWKSYHYNEDDIMFDEMSKADKERGRNLEMEYKDLTYEKKEINKLLTKPLTKKEYEIITSWIKGVWEQIEILRCGLPEIEYDDIEEVEAVYNVTSGRLGSIITDRKVKRHGKIAFQRNR